jgi:mannosyltransferase OCH1-like enzyme
MRYKKEILYVLLFLVIVFIIVVIIITIDLFQDDKKNLNNYLHTVEKYKNKISEYKIEDVEESKEIDKNIIQIYFQGREKIPDYVFDNIERKNSKLGWKYHFFDEEMIKEYLKSNYGDDFVKKLNSFEKYAHKADLFRLCWLYKNGGFYLDIDTELLVDADKILEDSLDIFTAGHNVIRKHSYQNYISELFGVKHDTFLNGIMIVNKGNKLLKKCIERIMMITQEDLKNNYAEFLFLIQDTVGKNFIYSWEERYFFKGDGSKFYNKKGEHIANEKYKNYKNGKFV